MTKQPSSPFVRTFHNLKNWSPVLERKIYRVGPRLYPLHTYGATEKVGTHDMLYRETDIPGSYLFYAPLFLDCVQTPADATTPYPFLVTLARQKIDNRKQIIELREELQEHLGIPF